MPQVYTPLKDEIKPTERLESLLEILGQTQAQILAQLDKIKLEHGHLSKELEEKLLLMLASPVQPPYL